MKYLLNSILVLLVFSLVSCNKSSSSVDTSTSAPSAEDSLQVRLITQAYLFGYPLMTMNYTHQASANVETDNGMGKGPINQWGNMRQFPVAGFTDVVRPNLDTYYSVIYADLSEGPLYLHLPATDRYYLMPILNAYGDVVTSLGSRTTGQNSIDLALIGPGYEGEVDNDLTIIRSTTNLNWLLGRVAVKNDEDGKKVVENFQSQLIARPLSERNNSSYTNPKGIVNSDLLDIVPMDEVDNKDISSYLNEMMALMIENPAYPSDSVLLNKLKEIGITPGGTFDLNEFSSAAKPMIENVPNIVQGLFAQMTSAPPVENLQNGWNVITSGLGEYGTEYFLRAYVTKIGYGANQSVDAIYPNAAVDMDGNTFNGSNSYILHFDSDNMPPVNGFWSLTMYDKKGFLVANEIDRYNLGSMKDLNYNEDGSLDIFIQAEPPLGKEANWLPSTKAGEEFELTFRMYYPQESVLDRSYTMPGVMKIEE